jgi:outer membrane protein
MLKKLALIIIASAFSVAFANPASPNAVSQSIAVIDLDKVLQSIPQVKAADEGFKKDFTPREAAIKKAADALTAEVNTVKKNRSVMTTEELTKAEAKIQKDQRNLDAMQAQFSQDLQTAQTKAMQLILNTVQKTVSTLATANGYSMVILKNNTLYYKPDADITQKVITALKK